MKNKNIFKETGFWATICLLYSLLAIFFDLPCHYIVPAAAVLLIWVPQGCPLGFLDGPECPKCHTHDS